MGRRKLVFVLVVIVWVCMGLCADERESFLLDYMNKAIWVDRKDKSNYDFDVAALFSDYNNDGQEEAVVAFHGDQYTDGWLWTMLHRGPNGVKDDAPPYSEVLKEERVNVFSFPYSFMCAAFRGDLRCILGRQMRINKYIPDGTKMGKKTVWRADTILTMDSKGHPQVHDLPHEIDDIVGNPGFEKLERAFLENYQGREMKRVPWNGTWRGFKSIPAEQLRPLGGIAQPPEFDDAFVRRYREEVKGRLNVTNDVTVLAVFHDADNDGDVDAYVSSSVERTGSDHYRWHLYLNNGKGAFVRATRRFWKRADEFDDAVYVEPEVVASRTAFHRLVRFGRLPALIVLEKVGDRLHTHGFLKYLTEEERRNQPHVGSALYDKEKARVYHEWGDEVNARLGHVRPFDLRELVDDFSFFRLERLPCQKFPDNKASCPSASLSSLDTCVDTEVPTDQIENDIKQVREMLLDARKMSPAYVTNICKRISDVKDMQTRSRLFSQLEDNAFSVDFAQIGDAHDSDEVKRDDVVRRLGRSYAFLESLVDEINASRMFIGDPPREHFEPLFRYYLAMRAESIRRGQSVRGYPDKLVDIEKMYGFSLKTGLFATNDYEWVRKTFRELAGHEMRTHEQLEHGVDLK